MLQTDQGEFETLAHLRYAYLQAFNGQPLVHEFLGSGVWDETTLHISDLGKCPRQQMYRLLGETKQAKSIDRLANDELMFWQGNMIHALTAGSLEWAGILVAFEKQLKNLPNGWSGRLDVLFKDREFDAVIGWDGKTVRPNAFDYAISWPKKEHIAQCQGYLCFETDVPYWLIEYIDRGGSNTPQTRLIPRDDEWVFNKIMHLDNYRSLLPILPVMLKPEFSIYYRKVNNEPLRRYNSVFVGPSWQCEWCDYHHGIQNKKTKEWTTFESSPCKPDMRKQQVGKTEKNVFKVIVPEYVAQVHDWLETQVLEYPIEEEEEVE